MKNFILSILLLSFSAVAFGSRPARPINVPISFDCTVNLSVFNNNDYKHHSTRLSGEVLTEQRPTFDLDNLFKDAPKYLTGGYISVFAYTYPYGVVRSSITINTPSIDINGLKIDSFDKNFSIFDNSKISTKRKGVSTYTVKDKKLKKRYNVEVTAECEITKI